MTVASRRPTDWFPLRIHDEEDHHAALRRKRRETPVEELAGLSGGGSQAWVAYRHDDVVRVLEDDEGMGMELVDERYGALLGDSFLTSAPTVRQAVRRGVAAAMPSGAELRQLVASVVDDVLDRLPSDGRPVDLVPALAPVAPRVLTRLLGLPDGDAAEVGGLAGAAAQLLTDRRGGLRAASELRARFRAVLDDGPPPSGLLRALSEVDVDGRKLHEDELLSSLCLLVWAGTETAFPGTITAVHALLAHPEQLAAVRRTPALLSSAVDEALRWDSPVQITGRRVRRPAELGDRRLSPGDIVLAHLGSANRDERRFPDADVYDVCREGLGHSVAFGRGLHRCLGQHVARVEVATAVERLLERHPASRLVPWSPAAEGQVVRSPRALLVELA